MTTAPDAFRIREAVAYFDASTDLEEAIDELLSSGFDRAEISLLATERAVEDQLGHRYHKVAELEDDPAVPRAIYIPREAIETVKYVHVSTCWHVFHCRAWVRSRAARNVHSHFIASARW